MMKTITVVTIVSRRVGHVTLRTSARTSCKKANGLAIFSLHVNFALGANSTNLTVSTGGRSGGTRTPNPRFWRPVLCQLSYTPKSSSQPYSIIAETTPAPTVRPPSRMAKRSFSSMAIGTISSTSISTLSPGITISVPDGNWHTPVTSVVRK